MWDDGSMIVFWFKMRAATGGSAYRIGCEAIIAVLESDPDLMNLLSRNLAERNINRQSKATVTDEQSPEQKRESLAAVLLAKMLGIFRM
jgi:hypothetical protein